MTLNYVAAFGKIKLVLYDDRVKSSTNGLVQEIFLSNENHLLVSIPPMVWNRLYFKNNNSLLAVICDYKYDHKNEYIDDYGEFIRLSSN